MEEGERVEEGIGHSSSMCLADRAFLQTHVTFSEYLVFHELGFTCILLLLITLNKNTACVRAYARTHTRLQIYISEVFYTQSCEVLKQSHETKAGYCIFQIRKSAACIVQATMVPVALCPILSALLSGSVLF